MTTALLLSLLVAGTPAAGPAPAARADDPAIQIWISNDRRFLPGDRAKVQVRTREDGYLAVFHVEPDGTLRVLFPIDPGDDNFVRGGHKYEIRGRGGREAFTVDDHRGRGTVYAAVSHDPFRFDQFVLGDHWDYRNLAPQRLAADPEQELNELVRRMVDNSFDYDILSYDVLERVVYASNYDPGYSSDFYGSSYGCGYSYWGCGRSYYGSPYSVSIGLFFGRPYHRRFYDPFYATYDPFYDPFFYDPYYYRPFHYYRPFYPRPYYNTVYYPAYPSPFYGGYYHGYRGGLNSTPYRYRPSNSAFAGYRDRRLSGPAAVNTVYLPPRLRTGQPSTATPMRRVTDAPSANVGRPSIESRARPATGVTARRNPERAPAAAPSRDGGRRVENRMTEKDGVTARRAREPAETRSIIPDSRDNRDARNLPTEIRPRRAVERGDEPRGDDARPAPQIQARPSEARGDDSRGGFSGAGADSRPEPRAEPRPEPRAEPRRAEPQSAPPPVYRADPPPDRGGDRGSYSPPRSAPSDGGSRGGAMSGGRSGGGGGGGFRRR
jgi:uncharacterized protein DUF4384